MEDVDVRELIPAVLTGIQEELFLPAASMKASLQADIDVVRHIKLVFELSSQKGFRHHACAGAATRPLSQAPGLLCQCTSWFAGGDLHPRHDLQGHAL